MNAKQLISHFNLQPHPEGGYYAETYRSAGQLKTAHGTRNLATSIYFLLEKGQISKFHQLTSDEIWYYHYGSDIELHLLFPDGSYKKVILGMDLNLNCIPQFIIPAGTIFGACVISEGYTLLSCMVAPGFDFEDFRMVSRDELYTKYPKYMQLIERFT